MKIISPTIGRIVWFWAKGSDALVEGNQPEAAMVTYVHTDRMVNLMVIDHSGSLVRGVKSVELAQPEDTRPTDGCFCEWMPYQVGQAAKHEPKLESLPDYNIGSVPNEPKPESTAAIEPTAKADEPVADDMLK